MSKSSKLIFCIITCIYITPLYADDVDTTSKQFCSSFEKETKKVSSNAGNALRTAIKKCVSEKDVSVKTSCFKTALSKVEYDVDKGLLKVVEKLTGHSITTKQLNKLVDGCGL